MLVQFLLLVLAEIDREKIRTYVARMKNRFESLLCRIKLLGDASAVGRLERSCDV